MNSWAMLESITSNQDNRTSCLWIELRPLHMGYRQNTNSHMSRHAAWNASRHAISSHGRWHTIHATPYMVTKSEKPYRLHRGRETAVWTRLHDFPFPYAPLWQQLGLAHNNSVVTANCVHTYLRTYLTSHTYWSSTAYEVPIFWECYHMCMPMRLNWRLVNEQVMVHPHSWATYVSMLKE